VRVKNKIIAWTLLLIPLIVGMATVNIASAAGGSTVFIPPTFGTTLSPGTQFTIDIDVDYVSRLWGYQLTLSFDPTMLKGISVQNGPFLESAGGTAVVVPGPGFDNVAGTLGLFAAALRPVRNLPTGGGVLAVVTFEVKDYGVSVITFGPETGLADRFGRWIIHKEENPECFLDGYFDNTRDPPQLWIREKHGTFGGGAYPAWHVNLIDVEQTLYSKIANSGDGSAWVKVKFTVEWVEGAVTAEYWSNEAEVPAVYRDPDTGEKVYPLVTVATPPFIPGSYGDYTVTAALYFKSGDMPDYVLYEPCVPRFGGTGTARDIATKFKVAEQMTIK